VIATRWSGPAAAAFDDEARMATDTLRTAAARLDSAADALRRHAARVSGVLGDLARLGSAELDMAKDLLVHPDQLLPDAVEVLGGGVRVAGDVVGGALHLIGR
jgi:hypothetical protein